MNKKLFTKDGLYQVVNPTNAPDYDEFDYSEHYRKFFVHMSKTGAEEYTSPKYLREAITECSKGFTRDFRLVFEDGDVNNVAEALAVNKCFESAKDYFGALCKKFAGNLLEAIMDAFFKCANIDDSRLQPFSKFESTFGTDDDAKGVDGWLVSDGKMKIPVNAKHLAFDGITKDDVFMKLKASKHDFAKEYAEEHPELAYDVLVKTPAGVIFTDSAIGRNEYGRKLKQEQHPDVVVIDETGIFTAVGHHNDSIANVDFWNRALGLFEETFKKPTGKR